MSLFKYTSNVTEEEFRAALVDLEKAIAEKDTKEEWARFTGRALLFVGKIAISQIGFGPVITLVEDIFGDDAELITKILKMLGEQNETD
jgi:hypothetical protein